MKKRISSEDETEFYGIPTTYGALERLYYWMVDQNGRLFWNALCQQMKDEHAKAIGHAKAGDANAAVASLQFEGAIQDYAQSATSLREVLLESGILEDATKQT